MLRCPRCRNTFSDKRYCPWDGMPLAELDGPSKANPRDLLGTVVGGKYEVLACIGEGGMGEVYRVRHVAMGKLMAMKVLLRHLSRHEQAVLRFGQEARAASQLRHPHIISVYDFGVTVYGELYIVMEYLQGKDLFDVLKECRVMGARRAVHVMRQVCAGLEAAHRREVIHRDLKPENIFLCTDREFPDYVKILDFGIAKVGELGADPDRRAVTGVGTVFGTPEYLAPEQAAAIEIDHRADLYSLGIIMYRMVAGRLPFLGGGKSRLIHSQLHEMPMPFSDRQMPAEVPDELEHIIFRVLAKDPDDRYQSAEALKEALGRVDVRTASERAAQRSPSDPLEWRVFGEQAPPPVALASASGRGPSPTPAAGGPTATPAEVDAITEPLLHTSPIEVPSRARNAATMVVALLLLALLVGLGVWLVGMGTTP